MKNSTIESEIYLAKLKVLNSTDSSDKLLAIESYQELLEFFMPWIEQYGCPLTPTAELEEHLTEDYRIFRNNYLTEGPRKTYAKEYKSAIAVALVQVTNWETVKYPNGLVGFFNFREVESFKGKVNSDIKVWFTMGYWIRKPLFKFDIGDLVLGLFGQNNSEHPWYIPTTSKLLLKEIEGIRYLVSAPQAIDYWHGFEAKQLDRPPIIQDPLTGGADRVAAYVLWEEVAAWMRNQSTIS